VEMKGIIVLLIFAFVITAVQSFNCQSLSFSCSSCQSQPGCSFCRSTITGNDLTCFNSTNTTICTQLQSDPGYVVGSCAAGACIPMQNNICLNIGSFVAGTVFPMDCASINVPPSTTTGALSIPTTGAPIRPEYEYNRCAQAITKDGHKCRDAFYGFLCTLNCYDCSNPLATSKFCKSTCDSIKALCPTTFKESCLAPLEMDSNCNTNNTNCLSTSNLASVDGSKIPNTASSLSISTFFVLFIILHLF